MSRDRIRYQDIKWAKDIPRRTSYHLTTPTDLAGLFLHVNGDNHVVGAIAFNSGGSYTVAAGNTVEGETSGASFVVVASGVFLESGTWGGTDAVGTLVVDSSGITGTFVVGETLKVGANLNVATVTGLNIHTLTDLSGNGRDITSNTTIADQSKFPVLIADSLNGHTVVDFDADHSLTHGLWDNSTEYVIGDLVSRLDRNAGIAQFFIALDASGSADPKDPFTEAAFWGPGVRSDFAGRTMKTANFGGLKAAPYTVCSVVNWDTGTETQSKTHSFVYDVLVSEGDFGNGADKFRIYMRWADGTFVSMGATASIFGPDCSSDPPLRYYVNAWSRHINRFPAPSTVLADWFINGRLAFTGLSIIMNGHVGIRNLQLGAKYPVAPAPSFLDGKVAELFMYDRLLSNTESLLIDEYFRNKYGLSQANS